MVERKTWIVEYVEEATREIRPLNKKEWRSLCAVVDKLKELGPDLVPPHTKSLKGQTNLFELRPRGGGSPVRPIYMRVNDGYKILAVACVKDQFDTAVSSARERAVRYLGS